MAVTYLIGENFVGNHQYAPDMPAGIVRTRGRLIDTAVEPTVDSDTGVGNLTLETEYGLFKIPSNVIPLKLIVDIKTAGTSGATLKVGDTGDDTVAADIDRFDADIALDSTGVQILDLDNKIAYDGESFLTITASATQTALKMRVTLIFCEVTRN